MYRAIATNHDDWSDSEIVHWYNQRGEASENRIKELKSDFGGDMLPCDDLGANDLYFNLTALAYNLYALLRDTLPGTLSRRRATTMRRLLYFLPEKFVNVIKFAYGCNNSVMFDQYSSVSKNIHCKQETQMRKTTQLVAAISLVATLSAVEARDNIMIVGSSTVYPFATVVAEDFGKSTSFKTPIIEATGSGGGMKLFCAGVGAEHPDITNASRRIKSSEFERCQANGVNDIVEVKVGYDGIVLGSSKAAPQLQLSLQDIFLALAKDVPNPDGSESIVANPYITWADVNSALPATKIEVLGPPPTSGTRDAFAELALEGGCKKVGWIKAMKKSDKLAYKALCHTIREDGAYIEAGENDNLIINKLQENPKALGVFGFSFLDQNADVIQGAVVEGVKPEFELIADGSYPVSRPLYFYAKTEHIGVIPGLTEFMMAFTNEDAYGEESYLTDKGLIPMPKEEREEFRGNVQNKTSLQM